MAMCVQEEERMKAANGGTINYMKDNKKQNNNANFSSKSKGKGPMLYKPQQNQFIVEKDQCLYYKKTGHYKKNCPDYLKMIMAKKGENIITFINESLYVQYSKSTWWIDVTPRVSALHNLTCIT